MAVALAYMTAGLQFTQQNLGWNAEPNIATPQLTVDGGDLLLAFPLNHFVFKIFGRGDFGILRFVNCSSFRTDGTNDDTWFSGTCRYSRLAPAWGEFYEISGPDPSLAKIEGWIGIEGSSGDRHFLFYLRDNLFECFAEQWRFEAIPQNALMKLLAAQA
ncbi:hypothetical protein [Mesorhizobium sp. 10J20-29]